MIFLLKLFSTVVLYGMKTVNLSRLEKILKIERKILRIYGPKIGTQIHEIWILKQSGPGD